MVKDIIFIFVLIIVVSIIKFKIEFVSVAGCLNFDALESSKINFYLSNCIVHLRVLLVRIWVRLQGVIILQLGCYGCT